MFVGAAAVRAWVLHHSGQLDDAVRLILGAQSGSTGLDSLAWLESWLSSQEALAAVGLANVPEPAILPGLLTIGLSIRRRG